MKLLLITGLLGVGFVAPAAFAHGDNAHKKPKAERTTVEEKPFGRPGDPKLVARTVTIDMDDTMHYSVDAVTVRQGETIRFVARNRGVLMHEMVLGTPKDIEEHAELMRKFPNMEHDEEYQLHVQPGSTGEMVWQFTRAGEFKFACLMPGHYEAGMVGKVVVLNRGAKPAQELSQREGTHGPRS
jgi:uncharacterized cupredoxin-like copper-binding protein